MSNQKLEKAAPVTIMLQFLPLPVVWQQPKMSKTSTKTRSSQTHRQMVTQTFRNEFPTLKIGPYFLGWGIPFSGCWVLV